MTVKILSLGNVLVSHWSGELTVADVEAVFQMALKMHGSGGKLAGISVLGPEMKRPSMDVLNKMMALHPRMRECHQSIHYVMLVNGFLASSLMSNVTRMLTVGTGGTLHFHKSVDEALVKAREYQVLTVSPQAVIIELRKLGIPLRQA